MNLRAIKLRGFKSFLESVEVRLEPGVAVVVGPNGSGKSNVSDAIVWAAGSLAPSELRAEKPDDVIFAGGGGRPAEDFCEVELLFDNPDGEGPLPYTELSVARRLHRGGEGQYLLNRTAVRRIDLVELLADLGLGGGMHSIIGQGRVEELLGSKPEERRELLEEAAGLGRFKKRKHRAELKLARVAIQVERAHDVEAEVKKRLRPLALQATAAERAEKLRGEIASLRARVAELDLAELRERLEDGEGRRTAAVLARKHADEQLDRLLEERRRAEEELADAAGRREQATATLYRLRSARERLELRRESAQVQLENLRAELARPRRVLDARVRAERETLREHVRVARERLQTLERALAEREGLPPAARALAEEGERLALSLLDVEPGTERAVAAALGHRAAALVADDARSALGLAERARAAGLGTVVVLTRDPSTLVRELPVVSKEQLLQSQVRAVTPEGFGYDPQRGELWFAGETAEAVWLELEAAAAKPAEGDDREELAERIERLERRRESLGQVNPLAKQEYDAEKERLVELATQRGDLEQSLVELEQLRDDLARTVEDRFAETFAAVQANFAEVASTLFPGGEGCLRLTEPEDEEEQPGIEVELRPAGKRVTRLSLLSGGEKALGAISFLFALFLARPCPFYLLDEVEAALDDTNIGRFVELLRRYSDRAQFIVVTHQKTTMEAADVLYGVTMGGDGVSQVVSRRLPREEPAAAVA